MFDIDIFLSDNEIRSLKVQLDHASRQLRDMNKNAPKTTENAELFSTIKVMDSIKLQGITCFSLWIFFFISLHVLRLKNAYQKDIWFIDFTSVVIGAISYFLFTDHEVGHALFGETETKTVLKPREAIDSLDDSIFLESPPRKEQIKTASNVTLKRYG